MRTSEEIIAAEILVASMIFVFSSHGWKNFTEEETAKAITEWKTNSSEHLIEALEKNNYIIVPKEPAFEKLVSNT